ncbi:MAG TPA: potassium channel family protein [Acidimicrobiia bacterium]|nr:potassium channel family protein [Acidimicrobiia bacterium]
MANKEIFTLEEAREIVRRFRLLAFITALVLLVGTVFYSVVEDLRWLDALYFSVTSLLTVGYGDISPKSDLGKFFTIFYLLIGVGILATFANIVLKSAVAKQKIRREEKEC